MYDAVGGRFVSRDPVSFEGSQWNLFEYVTGKPTVLLDPSGNRACKCEEPKDGCTKKPSIIDINNGDTGDIGKKHVVEFQCEMKHVKIRFHWVTRWCGYPYTKTSYTEETCRCKWVCTLTDIGNMGWVNASFGVICDKNHALWPTEKPNEILPPDNKAKK